MHDDRSNLIIGFDGCDIHAAQALIGDPNTIKISDEPHDWLGHGMYFWENNQERAKQWAIEKQIRKGKDVADAAVEEAYIKAGKPLPVNRDISVDPHKDKLLRLLDCINTKRI